MSVYYNLETVKAVALQQAKAHRCNYNIIIHNHKDGEFDRDHGSTYEFVADSYFNTARPNAVKLFRTDDLILQQSIKEAKFLLDKIFEPADEVKGQHILYKEFVAEHGRCLSKYELYLLFQYAWGGPDLKDESGNLGYKMKVKKKDF